MEKVKKGSQAIAVGSPISSPCQSVGWKLDFHNIVIQERVMAICHCISPQEFIGAERMLPGGVVVENGTTAEI